MDTTHATNPSCPCVPDYPQIGSDQYGFYISANEYNTSSQTFVSSIILAISKTALCLRRHCACRPTGFGLPLSNGI